MPTTRQTSPVDAMPIGGRHISTSQRNGAARQLRSRGGRFAGSLPRHASPAMILRRVLQQAPHHRHRQASWFRRRRYAAEEHERGRAISRRRMPADTKRTNRHSTYVAVDPCHIRLTNKCLYYYRCQFVAGMLPADDQAFRLEYFSISMAIRI